MPEAKVTRGQRSLLFARSRQPGRAGPAQGPGIIAQGSPPVPTARGRPCSQALAAGRGAGPIVRVQGAEPQITALRGAPLSPQHPGVGRDLVQRGPLRGPQGQTPLNELLALCGGRGGQDRAAPRHLATSGRPSPSAHLGRPSCGRRGGPEESPRPARRGCPRKPCRRAARPETTRWPSARGSGGSGSTPGGCTRGCLGDTRGLADWLPGRRPTRPAAHEHRDPWLPADPLRVGAGARSSPWKNPGRRGLPGRRPPRPPSWPGAGGGSHERGVRFHNKQM